MHNLKNKLSDNLALIAVFCLVVSQFAVAASIVAANHRG